MRTPTALRQDLDLIDYHPRDALAGRVDLDTPLIVLTSRVDELHRVRAPDRGRDDALAKPYSYDLSFAHRSLRCFAALGRGLRHGSCVSAR